MAGVSDADRFAAELLAAAGTIRSGTVAITVSGAADILGATVARAPRDSGAYKNSWRSRTTSRTDGVRVSLFTNEPAAARLEYGFHGRDSKGRVYDQAPRSHQRAAIDVVYPQMKAALTALAQGALRG